MNDYEKKSVIRSAISIIKQDFSTDSCGKHDSLALSCVSCQAAIVVNWLEETIDTLYS